MEYIGFIISVLALLYLFLKQGAYVRHAQEHEKELKEQELMEEHLEDLMKRKKREELSRKKARDVKPPSPKHLKEPRSGLKSPLEEHHLMSQIEKRQLKSSLENRHLIPTILSHEKTPFNHHLETEEKVTEPSRVKLAVRRLSGRRDLIIYQEIMNKPKSMRSPI